MAAAEKTTRAWRRNRRVVSDHAVIRWLERIEGRNIDKVYEEALIVTGAYPETEEDLLRYMQNYHRLDIRAVRRRIATPEVLQLIDMGANDIPIKNRRFRLRVRDGKITTISPLVTDVVRRKRVEVHD